MIPVFISVVCLITLILLGMLAIIDLRVRLLPNTYVLGVFLCGIAFHALSNFYYISPVSMVLGAIFGGGLLYVVRFFANAYYKTDTLGLGDVKLMIAGGVWLGVDGIFLAISLGAFAGVIHGLVFNALQREREAFSTFSIPAGPGFIVGFLGVAAYQFQFLPKILLDF